ncbi:hypothetical protein CDEST_08153 [Colletotrichum destructivum]|uniref:Secreted protein n=1 Tax=Colletotrichum destructivum TaxID=34406 RepID=A0AAX4IJW7_9PEZI|nr:hypothetical protein CDEST_08153 [Colletotrichum destructivum]
MSLSSTYCPSTRKRIANVSVGIVLRLASQAFAVAHGPGHFHPSIQTQYIPSHLLVDGESTNCGKPTQNETERNAVSKLIESRCHISLQFGWMQRRRSSLRIGKLHESLACPSCTEPPSRPPPSSLLWCG